MAEKPVIQYVGQFYVYGSEAKKVQPKKEKDPEKQEYTLPLLNIRPVQRLYVEPLAICSIVLAVAFLITMIAGTMQIQSALQEMNTVDQYVQTLEKENRILDARFRSGYDLEAVRTAALEMGMVPVEELPVIGLSVVVPQPEPETTQWELFCWFLEGLFA